MNKKIIALISAGLSSLMLVTACAPASAVAAPENNSQNAESAQADSSARDRQKNEDTIIGRITNIDGNEIMVKGRELAGKGSMHTSPDLKGSNAETGLKTGSAKTDNELLLKNDNSQNANRAKNSNNEMPEPSDFNGSNGTMQTPPDFNEKNDSMPQPPDAVSGATQSDQSGDGERRSFKAGKTEEKEYTIDISEIEIYIQNSDGEFEKADSSELTEGDLCRITFNENGSAVTLKVLSAENFGAKKEIKQGGSKADRDLADADK